jgi:hypothetical protein
MEQKILLVRLGFLAFGLLNVVFGVLLLGSSSFFHYWQDRFWKEKDDAHKTKERVFYNKYVTGAVSVFIGIVCLYYAVFAP